MFERLYKEAVDATRLPCHLRHLEMMQAPEHNKRYSEGKEKSGNYSPDEKKSFLLEVGTG
jgi:hypothetical protein